MNENSDTKTTTIIQCYRDKLYLQTSILREMFEFFDAKHSLRWATNESQQSAVVHLMCSADMFEHILNLYHNAQYLPDVSAGEMQHLFAILKFLQIKELFKPTHWFYVDENKWTKLTVHGNVEKHVLKNIVPKRVNVMCFKKELKSNNECPIARVYVYLVNRKVHKRCLAGITLQLREKKSVNVGYHGRMVNSMQIKSNGNNDLSQKIKKIDFRCDSNCRVETLIVGHRKVFYE